MPSYWFKNRHGDVLLLGEVVHEGEYDMPAVTLMVTDEAATASQWADALAAGQAPDVDIEGPSAYTPVDIDRTSPDCPDWLKLPAEAPTPEALESRVHLGRPNPRLLDLENDTQGAT